jgi:hypothetical protein
MDDFRLIPYYVVQTFAEVDGQLVPDMPLDASSASEAANVALAFKSCKAGVIAFEWVEEMRHGRFVHPFVLAAFGQIPEECQTWIKTGAKEERAPRKKPALQLSAVSM